MTRRRIGQLASHQQFDRHQHQLVRHAGEGEQRLAELASLPGIAQREVEGVPADPDSARRGLDTRALESAHQLLEPLPLGTA